jgi:hypothetical protein
LCWLLVPVSLVVLEKVKEFNGAIKKLQSVLEATKESVRWRDATF